MFDKFFSFFSHDIGIDLGTANTLVWVKGKGVVIREPSVIAMHKKTKKVIAVGTEAKKMVGKTPQPIVTIKPLKSGIIADFDAATSLISHYIQKVHEVGKPLPSVWARPKVVIGIPSSVTEVQRRAVWEAALTAGARSAYLIEEPMAAAIGENISIFQPTGIMIVDIGGGTTEIAVISLGGIVVGRSLKVAGNEMDQAIVHYIRLKHGLILGETTAEEVKIKIGSAFKKNSKTYKKITTLPAGRQATEDTEKDSEKTVVAREASGEKMAIVRGRDIETGLPRSLRISEVEIREALAPVLSQIIEGIVDTLEDSPPELTADILERGILLTGGGASLSGIDHLIVERTRMSVIISDEPLLSVVKGTGKVLEDQDLLSRVKVIGGLK